MKMEAVGSSSSARLHGVTAVMNIVLSYCGKVKMHRSYIPYYLQKLAYETSDEAYSNSLAPTSEVRIQYFMIIVRINY